MKLERAKWQAENMDFSCCASKATNTIVAHWWYEHKQYRCSNNLLIAPLWSLIMSAITKTRCSAPNPSSNRISKLSIQSQALCRASSSNFAVRWPTGALRPPHLLHVASSAALILQKWERCHYRVESTVLRMGGSFPGYLCEWPTCDSLKCVA